MIPDWPNLKSFQQEECQYKEQQEASYNKHHHTQPLPSIPNDEQVWITTETDKDLGKIIAPADTPKSHIVETDSEIVRRNHQHLTVIPERPDTPTEQGHTSSRPRTSPIMTRCITGIAIVSPDRLY